jgi:hypothetical protein
MLSTIIGMTGTHHHIQPFFVEMESLKVSSPGWLGNMILWTSASHVARITDRKHQSPASTVVLSLSLLLLPGEVDHAYFHFLLSCISVNFNLTYSDSTFKAPKKAKSNGTFAVS